MRNFILAILVRAISFPVAAETLQANQPVCLTEDLLTQLNKAAFEQDMPALEYLAANGCSMSSAPLHATILEVSSWGTMVHIRAYRDKHAVEVWTFRSALAGQPN